MRKTIRACRYVDGKLENQIQNKDKWRGQLNEEKKKKRNKKENK